MDSFKRFQSAILKFGCLEKSSEAQAIGTSTTRAMFAAFRGISKRNSLIRGRGSQGCLPHDRSCDVIDRKPLFLQYVPIVRFEISFLVKANVYDSKKDFDAIKILNKTKKMRKTEAEEAKKTALESKKAKEEAKKAKEEAAESA